MNKINIKDLTQKDIGRSVQYIPFENCKSKDYEYGHITSFNDVNVFVDYGKNCGKGTGTNPLDLRFINSKQNNKELENE